MTTAEFAITVADLSEQTLILRSSCLRHSPTKAERILCARLKELQVAYTFQELIGWYIVDVGIPSKMIIFELDGDEHFLDVQCRKDQTRTEFLNKFGFHIIRVRNKHADITNLSLLKDIPTVTTEMWAQAVLDANQERHRILLQTRRYSSNPLTRQRKMRDLREQYRKAEITWNNLQEV